jgi:hypothetical protein
MHELVDRTGIALEVPDKLFIVATPLQRRKAEFLVQLGSFGHFSDVERVGPHFVQ